MLLLMLASGRLLEVPVERKGWCPICHFMQT